MKLTLAIVLLFGVFHVIMSDTSPSSEENSGEYVDAIREKRQAPKFPNGTTMNFPANGNKTWPQGMGPGYGNGTKAGQQGMGQGPPGSAQGNWQGKPPQKQ